jgi:hypothetical protein
MKALYIYNEFDANEIALIDRVKTEFGEYLEEVKIGKSQELKDVYNIRTTPALIILRDDLQGANLLAEGTDGKLLITGEVAKAYDLETKALYGDNAGRTDNLINTEAGIIAENMTRELKNTTEQLKENIAQQNQSTSDFMDFIFSTIPGLA